jgi:hypothetical protein
LLLLLAGLLLAAVHSVESKSHSLQPQSQSHSKAAIFLPTINNPAMAAVVLVAAVVDPAAAANESSFEKILVYCFFFCFTCCRQLLRTNESSQHFF